ncbi:MAG TPA: glycosyltransferase [Planctomycetaceae bacterium]|nr:glycosyltransferase [Planctomycetaceae bacterium]
MPVEQSAIPESPAEAFVRARPLRVAFVVHTFEVGGIERSVARLASRIDRRRFEPQIVCLDRNGQAAQWLETDDVPIFELKKRAGNDLGLVFRLARLLRHERIDIVHSHNWGTLVETSLARRRARVPVHVHAERGTVLGSVEIRGLRGFLRAAAMRWAVNRTSAVVSNAVAVARRAAGISGLPLETIQIIPNGLDAPAAVSASAVRETRSRWGLPQEARVVGSIGRLAEVKNFASAITAISQLSEADSNVHLLLVGDGPERTRLEDLARTLGIAHRIHFAGFHDDVNSFLAAMDVYINCSHSEGMSQSLVEAMAAGLPIIATEVGDNALLVGGERSCGVVVRPGDPEAIAAAIKMLTNDAELRGDFGRRARARFAERYSMSRMVESYEKLYSSMYRISPRPGLNSR